MFDGLIALPRQYPDLIYTMIYTIGYTKQMNQNELKLFTAKFFSFGDLFLPVTF